MWCGAEGLLHLVDAFVTDGEHLPAVVGGAQVGVREGTGQVVCRDSPDRAQRDAGQLEGVAHLEGRVADAEDDAGRHRDEVDRVGEVDVVL